MELWQLDVVGGFLLADGTRAKALTGVDDHWRFCVSARLMPAERTQPVCDAFALAMRSHGVPEQVLTDNGKVFTGRFFHPPVEVLFDRICRENGIEHLLTAPRSPTTTGKIERFHRTLRAEFDTTRVFRTLTVATPASASAPGRVRTPSHRRGRRGMISTPPQSGKPQAGQVRWAVLGWRRKVARVIKCIITWRAAPGLTHEEAVRYWTGPHKPIADAMPGVQHYVQNPCVPDPLGGPPTASGVGELWFTDMQAARGTLDSTQWQAMLEDSARFVDMNRVAVNWVEASP